MPQEPTTARRPAGDAEDAVASTTRLAPPAPPASARRARLPAPALWAIVACLVALAGGAAFLLTRPGDPMSDPRPVEVVRGFASAIEARDTTRVLSYVEPTVFRREISPEIRSYVERLVEVRFANPSYQLLESDGETARVRWTATMRYTIGQGRDARSGERPIDTTFELRKIEGTWYLHSAKLPQ